MQRASSMAVGDVHVTHARTPRLQPSWHSVNSSATRRMARSHHTMRIACVAGPDEPGPSNNVDDNSDLSKARQQLDRIMSAPVMTGGELRQLVFEKWGRTYDVRLQRRGNRMYLHVMWKHLEQQSFPLTEEEYQMQLEAVAEYLNMWGVTDTVRAGIKSASKRGPGYTGGGNAKAISIPLDVQVGDGARSGEWNSFLS